MPMIGNYMTGIVVVFIFCLISFHGNIVLAIDFSYCANELEQLSSSSEDAANAAREADSAKDRYESEKEEYDRCRRFPDVYDLYGDRCQSKYRSAKDAQDDLESSISHLENTLYDVSSAIDDVETSCGYDFAPPAPISGVVPEHQAMCFKFRRIMGKLKSTDILKLCGKYMSESECKACFNIK